MESYSGEEETAEDKCFLHCQSPPTSPPPNTTNTNTLNESSTLTNDSNGEEFCDQDRCTEEETKLLAHTHDSGRTGSIRESSSSQFANSPIIPPSTTPNDALKHPRAPSAPFDPLHKKDPSHSYQFRRKLANFRSDSVFSDVTPHTCQESQNSSSSDSAAKSGSLSSLKPRESKWTSLRKKLGKLNSSTTKKSLEQQQQQQEKPSKPGKSVEDKRSLLQRAKTLSILPVRSSSKDKEDHPKKPVKERRIHCVDEHFVCGGEMNMIPLELLIDVNDLNVNK